MCQGLNSHYFHIYNRGWSSTRIVGAYIPIIRIPIKGGMTIPNIATFDHGTHIYIYIHSCLDRISANIRKLLPVVPASVVVAQSVERIDTSRDHCSVFLGNTTPYHPCMVYLPTFG